MGFYDSEENVKQYIRMAEGYDGRLLIRQLGRYLPAGSTVLEIGMGAGKDLALLGEKFHARGSDSSEIFVKHYLKTHPEADVRILDAVRLEINETFNAIYSNKVLQHLNYAQMTASFKRQAEILEPGGIALHSFWYGSEVENFDGLMFHQLTNDRLETLANPHFETLEIRRYKEMEDDDSLYGIFRLR